MLGMSAAPILASLGPLRIVDHSLSTYWPMAVVLALLAGVIWMWVWWTRRGHRLPGITRWRRGILHVAWGLGVLTAMTLAAALGVNAYAGYIPSFTALHLYVAGPASLDPSAVAHFGAGGGLVTGSSAQPSASPSRSTVLQATIPSQSPHVPGGPALIYLPAGYETGTARYPVVYALHGSPGTASDWFVAGQSQRLLDRLITSHRIPPVILVSPQVTAGVHVLDEPLNEPDGPQYEHYVSTDVVRWTDAHLRTVAQPDDRVIAGMSSGGLGAFVIGAHKSDVFAGAGVLLPYLHPYTAAVKESPRARAENSPLQAIRAAPGAGSAGQHYYIGQDLNGAVGARRMVAGLREAGRTAHLRIFRKAHHNWVAVRTMLPPALEWLAHQLHWAAPTAPATSD